MFCLIMPNKWTNTYMNKQVKVKIGLVGSYSEVGFAVPVEFSKTPVSPGESLALAWMFLRRHPKEC